MVFLSIIFTVGLQALFWYIFSCILGYYYIRTYGKIPAGDATGCWWCGIIVGGCPGSSRRVLSFLCMMWNVPLVVAAAL
jgi:hypothetical protein